MNHSWKNDRNYRRFRAADGSSRYVVTVEGIDVEVTAEVFTEYARLDRYERYQREKSAGKLLSVDRIIGEDSVIELCPAIVTDSAEVAFFTAESAAERQRLLERLPQAMSRLTEQERFIITALYLDGQSERDVARTLGVSQPAIHKRQTRLLKKLKDLFAIS